MRSLGYVNVHGSKVLVLYADKKYSRLLKHRISGKDGIYLEDESAYLKSNPKKFDELISGKVIEL